MDPSQPPQDSPAPQQPPQPPQPPRQDWPISASAPGQGPVPGPYGSPPPGPYTAPGPYTSPPPGPYGPYGPGAGPGPYGMRPPGTNGLAIASFVSGIVCCLPPLGLVLGLIALPQIKKKGQKGRGFAVAGIALSAVACALTLVGIVTGGFSEFWRGFKEGMDDAANSSTLKLRKGDCFRVDGKLEGYTTDVKKVSCTTPHEGEVTGDFKVSGAEWPGEKALGKIAESRCDRINSAYAMDTWAVPESAVTFYYAPTKESWKRLKDRTVTCALATEEKPFTASVRGDETTLNRHQLHYLKSMNPIDDALFTEPTEDAVDDLAANKEWARKVHRAVVAAGGDLGGHDWPGGSAKPLEDLAKELDAAARSWHELATAKDAAAFSAAYDEAYDALSSDIEAQARAALDLAEIPVGGGSDNGSDNGGGSGSDGSGGSGSGSDGGSGSGEKV